MKRALYFGCLRGAYGHTQAGHHFYGPHGSRADTRVAERVCPWVDRPNRKHVDGQLAPRPRGPHSEADQGQALLHHKGNWTAISFWDRTGDSRGGSSSTFLMDGTLSFEEALEVARANFPELFDRFTFEVVEYGAPT